MLHYKEIDFLEQIDCKFPYNDFAASRRFIDLAMSFSENAMFAILYELLNNPAGTHLNADYLAKVLAYIDKKFHHPLKETVFSFIKARHFQAVHVSDKQQLAAFELVRPYRGLYAALVLIHSCKVSAEADLMNQEIRQEWES